MSFSKRAVHTLEGNGTTIGVKDCHAYVDGQVMCLSQGSLEGTICFGKSNRHVVRLVLRARPFCQFFTINVRRRQSAVRNFDWTYVTPGSNPVVLWSSTRFPLPPQNPASAR